MKNVKVIIIFFAVLITSSNISAFADHLFTPNDEYDHDSEFAKMDEFGNEIGSYSARDINRQTIEDEEYFRELVESVGGIYEYEYCYHLLDITGKNNDLSLLEFEERELMEECIFQKENSPDASAEDLTAQMMKVGLKTSLQTRQTLNLIIEENRINQEENRINYQESLNLTWWIGGISICMAAVSIGIAAYDSKLYHNIKSSLDKKEKE